MRTHDLDTTVNAIDHTLAEDSDPPCQECGHPRYASPSPDFCSEDCQQLWYGHRTLTTPTGAVVTPDESLPETAPARSLSWLGTPPPGTSTRPGHEVLDSVAAFVGRYSVFPDEHCAPTLALWYAHTHAVDQFYVTPRLVIDSAEPESGKTRVLEVAQHFVAAPEMTISATHAALFRLVSMGPITILFDEVDTVFNPKNGGTHEDIRGLLNAGYKRSATIARCVGDAKNMTVQRFAVYAPAALVGIEGGMPATITTRAITIHMRRRRAEEHVEPFQERDVAHQAQPLRAELAAWVTSTGTRLGDIRPLMPEGITDRAAEIWEPLLAIADTAGDHWPTTVRNACRHFVLHPGARITSPGVQLLADLHTLFTQAGTGGMRTTEILTALHAMDEAPWAELDGRPFTARRLASELRRYGARPVTFETPDGSAKGYVTYPTTGRQAQTGLADAWARYLPATIGKFGKNGKPAGQTLTDSPPLTDPSVSQSQAPSPALTDPSVSPEPSVSP
ncbi:MAG: DUF3631 domain-containing protein [Pseudonocardiaceae bacterium]